MLNAELWTPEAEGAAPRLLQAIRDARKGQAELSEVLGERVREAVEILIRGHGEPLRALTEQPEIDNAEYRQSACGSGTPTIIATWIVRRRAIVWTSGGTDRSRRVSWSLAIAALSRICSPRIPAPNPAASSR